MGRDAARALATGRVAFAFGGTFARAAGPVPVSGERPARVLADGTQFSCTLVLQFRRAACHATSEPTTFPQTSSHSVSRPFETPLAYFVFASCGCLRPAAAPSWSASSLPFEVMPPEKAERSTSEAKKLRPSVGTMMICNLSESRSAMIF